MKQRSIRSRLTFYALAYLGVIITLAGLSGVRFLSVEATSSELAGTYLQSTQVLGELADQLAEFRLAETYRALTVPVNLLPVAELQAQAHRQSIDALADQYLSLTAGKAGQNADFVAFRQAAGDYFRLHDAWVLSDTLGTDDAPALPGSLLHRSYVSADNAVDRLVQANKAATIAAADSVRGIVDQTLTLILMISATAVLVALALLVRVYSDVTSPLTAMTAALTRLAAGHKDVQVPALDRDDEIGAMAKAFDIFRSNARALEHAHAVAQEAQEQAQLLARHDALTGLPNRRVFASDLQTALARVMIDGGTCSVFIIDLDSFKQVNDLQGHPIGDLVLCEVAERLRKGAREGDTVARLGGDEFAIIAPGNRQAPHEAEMRLAQRLIDAVSEPIVVGNSRIQVGASIGIASAPSDGMDADDLIRAADIAMYRAKRDGRGVFRFFEQSMDEELRDQAALEADLRRAIADGEIRPQYQPLVDLTTHQVYGFEVLARWQHPERGWVSPEVFIPLAERMGLIATLTSTMLRQACHDAANWDSHIRLSFNISPFQLTDAALPMHLLTILDQEGFPPGRLEIEITESALLGDIETAKFILTALQGIGVKISLDDFGTGYSSLNHLRELKFDKVKIDRSFVQSMQQDAESEKIVDAILGLTRSIGVPTIAEGIENPEIRQSLAEKGCEFGQGYLFGKAMTAADAATVLGAQRDGAKLLKAG